MATLPPSDFRLNWVPNVASSGTTTYGVGKIGGIPAVSGTARNVVDYGADPTGVVACDSAFVSARNDANTLGGYIYFPAGTFRLNNAYTRLNFVRGAGIDLTTVNFYTGDTQAFSFGDPGAYSNPGGSDAVVVSSFSKGTTSVQVGYVGDFMVGSPIWIFFSDDVDTTAIEAGLFPVIGPDNPGFKRKHTARVTAINGGTNTVTFYPPIMHTPAAGQTAYAKASQSIASANLENNYIADITLNFENSGSTFALSFWDVYNGFLQNVRVERAARYGIATYWCIHLEMRGCSIEEAQLIGSSNTAGYLAQHCTGCWIEDNSFIGLFPGWEINYGCSGNAFTYNYFDRSTSNINHGALNQYNLYWGNLTPQIKSDGYFGGSLYDCIGRNWITGRESRIASAGQIGMVELKRFTYGASLVANYYGTLLSSVAAGSVTSDWGKPNIGNSSSTGTANAIAGDWWVAWNEAAEVPWTWTGTVTSGGGTASGVLTMDDMSGPNGFSLQANNVLSGQINFNYSGGSRTGFVNPSSISGSTINISGILTIGGDPSTLPADGTAITVVISTASFQELDELVGDTAFRSSNYYLSVTPGVTGPDAGDTPIGADTIDDCLLYGSSKPAWMGNKPFPIFGVERAEEPDYTDLPAAHRYILGNKSYLNSVADPEFTPGGGTFVGSTSVTITCTTPGADIRYTVDGSTPNEVTGTVYTGPVSITSSLTLKAIAYDGILENSLVVSEDYVITPPVTNTITVDGSLIAGVMRLN